MSQLQTTQHSAPVNPGTASNANRFSDATLTPPVDVVEDAGGITVFADLPGVSAEKLNLQVERDALTIEAETDFSIPAGLSSSHAEVRLAKFRRVFTLSHELDTDHVQAELSAGVLKLRIPKAAHAKPRRIEVRAT